MKKHLFGIVAAGLCLSLALTGCQSVVTAGSVAQSAPVATATPRAEGTLTLACTSAGFNPYIASDMLVQQNWMLLFEPLVAVTPDMDIDYRLAQSVDSSGTLVTIQIRSGCYFSDGTEVTAEDAAASLNAARTGGSYTGRFANVTDVSVQGSAVVVALTEPDSLFTYLLDIPVMKAGEVALAQPTASGRYTYGSDGASLVQNPRASAFDGPAAIQLTTVSSADALISGVARGEISLYAESGGSSDSSSINTSETYYRTDSLIFAGINSYSANWLCSTVPGRQLLSTLCDRSGIAGKALGGRAYAATGIINGYYPCVKGRQVILSSDDSSTLESVMAGAGYTRADASGFYKDARGNEAYVRLLVYSATSDRRAIAAQLQEQWQAAGIRVDITEQSDRDIYLQTVQSGDFDLYIGEVKLYNNMDLSPFWAGEAHWGLAPSDTLLAAYSAFRQNAGNAEGLEAAFAAEMPFLPLVWHNGTVVASRRVSGIGASISSPFYSLSGLQVSS